MPEQSFTSLAGDWIALLTGAFALAGIVWGAVMRATKPLRDRLERVDDLNDRVAGLERRLGGIERRIEDLHHLDPCRMRRDHHVPLDEVGDDEHRPG